MRTKFKTGDRVLYKLGSVNGYAEGPGTVLEVRKAKPGDWIGVKGIVYLVKWDHVDPRFGPTAYKAHDLGRA